MDGFSTDVIQILVETMEHVFQYSIDSTACVMSIIMEINIHSRKRGVWLEIKNSSSHRPAVVQYFHIDLLTFNLTLRDQYIYDHLLDLLYYLYVGETIPVIIVVKFYSDSKNEIYLISIQINVESIDK